MEMENNKKKVYTSEFKSDAVNLAESSPKPATQVARQLGISVSVLRNWIYESRGRQGTKDKLNENMSLEEKIKVQEKRLPNLEWRKKS
jgi:transposase-like protein